MAENNSPPPLMTDKELLMETGAFNEIMNAAFEYADAYCASGDEPRRYSAAIDHLRKTVRAEITKFSRADYKTNASTEFDAQAAPAAVAVPNTCRDTFRFGGRCEKHICPKPCQQCAALAANPEATEDSSAGDLAEVRAEPVIYVSRGQLENHTDPESDGGRYLPARRTPLGLLNYPLYTAPQAQPADALDASRGSKWLTVVYRDVQPGDEAREIGSHQKVSALSWSHAIHDRDAAMAAAQEGGNAAKEA